MLDANGGERSPATASSSTRRPARCSTATTACSSSPTARARGLELSRRLPRRRPATPDHGVRVLERPADTLTTIDCGPAEGPFTAPVGHEVDRHRGGRGRRDERHRSTSTSGFRARATRPSRALTRSTARRRSTTSRRAACRPGDVLRAGLPVLERARGLHRAVHVPRRHRDQHAAGTQPLANTPKWKAFLTNPPTDYSTNDTRTGRVLARLARQPQRASTPTATSRSRTPRRAPVGLRLPGAPPTRRRSATTRSRLGVGRRLGRRPAARQLRAGRARRAAASRRPQLHRHVDEPVVHEQVRPDGARARAATTSCPPSRTSSPATTGCTTSRTSSASPRRTTTPSSTTSATRRRGRTRPAARATRSWATSRPARSTAVRRSTSRDATTRTRSRCNDGIPPITNQYLFQPIAGAFYAPCVDGDMDTSVFGARVHAPDLEPHGRRPRPGLSGYQAGAMGESWSDLDALEYLWSSYNHGADPLSSAPYATGNTTVGIRDYAVNHNPLNYSDLGFDTPGAEVHADGEIWNGTNFDVRQALVNKYNATYPSATTRCSRRAPDGKHAGRRRAPATGAGSSWCSTRGCSCGRRSSMLDARDAYLAADLMRFGGANQTELWRAFAQRGMGSGASTTRNATATRRRASSRPPRRTRPSRSARSRRSRATRRCRRRSTSASTRTAPCRSPTRIRHVASETRRSSSRERTTSSSRLRATG